jgi:transcriptional regulator with AAA-type ATPase domain/tetratricopeptide (TPR) repeat protein
MNPLAELIGESPAMETLRREVRRLLDARTAGRLPAVLIQGETGSGKGLVARVLHRGGPRSHGPFVDVNCAAIPETLLESELFGFERGAFTDARRSKPGLFQTAHRGTIFLDEVGLLPDSPQAKLLTVLEERSVRRLGATEAERIDVWVLSATNADLQAAVRARRFREDLYHRLAVLTITLPPLRERGRDVLLLAESFLARACQEYGLPAKRLAPEAEARLQAYRWPGNVRELANVLERVALLTEGETVTADMLGLDDEAAATADPTQARADVVPASASEAAREHLRATLERTGWNISRTAAQLGLSRNTVRARIERFQLRPDAAPRLAPVPVPASAEVLPPTPESVVPAPSAPRAGPAATSPAAIRWERRPVTFLRTTLALPSEEDPPDTSRTLELIVSKILSFGGRVEEIGQTSLDATFGVEPLEDAPRRAANAALAVVKGVESGEEGAAPVRIAIHASSVLVGRVSGAAAIDRSDKRRVSDEIDVLLALAQPGTIVLTAATGPLLDRRFKLAALSGSAGSGPPLRLAGRGGFGLGFGVRMSPFVGRAAEMDLLQMRWTAATEGRGQVVGIVGEPGVGKSRLLWEFAQRRRREGAAVAEATGEALATPTAYGIVLELLRAHLGIEPGAEAAAVRARVIEHVQGLEPAFAPIVPPVLALLDVPTDDREWRMLDAPQRRLRTLDAIKALFLRESRRRPLVLAVEDGHWLDSESQALLDTLVEGLPTARLLLVVTYRPEYRHRWGSYSYYTQLRVDPLHPTSAREFVHGLIGERPSLTDLPQRLVEWTAGNPLFLEEMVRSLAETGTLVGERGAYDLVTSVTSLRVPGSVEDVLAGRIDRLRERERALLQSAAVIGRDVPTALLSAVVTAAEEDLRDGLGLLREAEFLYEAGIFPETAYTFKHPLTHAVAYRSLPDARRRVLHAGVLKASEEMYADRLPEQMDRLAHHALLGEVWAKALSYARQAGARAVARSANSEAAACFAQALTALDHLPETRQHTEEAVDLHLLRANALVPIADFGPIIGHLRQAEQLAYALEDLPRLGRVSSFLSAHAWLVGDHPLSIEHGRRALDIARSVDDLGLRVRTTHGLGQTYHSLGDYPRAIEALERNISDLQGDLLGRRFGMVGVASVLSRVWLVWCLAELGEFDRAMPSGEEAVRIAEAIDHPYSRLAAYFGLGCLHLRRGEIDHAIAVLDPALELCRSWDTQVRLWFMGVAPSLGHAYALSGKVTEAIPLLERAMEQAAAVGSMFAQSLRAGWLAQAYLVAGRRDEAARQAAEALALARRHQERGHEVWIHGIIGDIAAHGETPDPAAEQAYHTQIALAETCGMRPRLAIGRLRLGGFYRRTGRAAEAREHLEAAVALLSAMRMPLWLDEAHAELSTL